MAHKIYNNKVNTRGLSGVWGMWDCIFWPNMQNKVSCNILVTFRVRKEVRRAENRLESSIKMAQDFVIGREKASEVRGFCLAQL